MRVIPRYLLFYIILTVVSGDEFAFFDSCVDGDVTALLSSMESGNVDVNYPDENGMTPLILAAKHGKLDIISALLDANADIELAAEYPAQVDTPLSAAAQNGFMDVVKLLLSRGAKVDGQGRDGRTPLMAAAAQGKTDIVEYLVTQGADVDATKYDGTSALFWAGFDGHADTVVFLLASEAQVDRRDFVDGSQPIHLASGNTNNGTRAVLSHLITFGADPNARTGVTGRREADGSMKENPKREDMQGGRTPLMVAAAEGNVAAVEFLTGMVDSSSSSRVEVDAQDVQGNSALALAAMQGKVKVLSTLLAAGAEVDLPNANALAPLHHAAYSGQLECVRRLLKAKATVDQPSALMNGAGAGHTPLLLAAAQGHAKVSRLLLKAGANPNRPAKDGATSLIAAASGGHRKTVKALLKKGADPRARLFESGETASMLTSNRVVGALLYYAELELRIKEEEAKLSSLEEGEEDVSTLINLDEVDLDNDEDDTEDDEEDAVMDEKMYADWQATLIKDEL